MLFKRISLEEAQKQCPKILARIAKYDEPGDESWINYFDYWHGQDDGPTEVYYAEAMHDPCGVLMFDSNCEKIYNTAQYIDTATGEVVIHVASNQDNWLIRRQDHFEDYNFDAKVNI